MTTKEKLFTLLKSGSQNWNDFIKKSDREVLDLSSIKISKFKFKNYIFHNVTFDNSDLSHCKFYNTEFISVNFKRSDIAFCYFESCRFESCNFEGSDLYSSDCQKVQINNCDFISSNMSNVNLTGAEITNCDFRLSRTTGLRLPSRSSLKGLIHFLSNDQISGIIFEDEEIKYGDYEGNNNGYINLKIHTNNLSPFNLSYLLMAIEGTYNNLYFLSKSHEISIKKIIEKITPYYQGVSAKESLHIKKISNGSIIIEIATIASSTAGILLTLSKAISVISNQLLEHKKLALEHEKVKQQNLKNNLENDIVMINNIKEITSIYNKNPTADPKISNSENISDISKLLPIENIIIKKHKEELIEESIKPLQGILKKYESMGIDIEANFEKTG